MNHQVVTGGLAPIVDRRAPRELAPDRRPAPRIRTLFAFDDPAATDANKLPETLGGDEDPKLTQFQRGAGRHEVHQRQHSARIGGPKNTPPAM